MVLSIIVAIVLGYFAYLEHSKDNTKLHQQIQATIIKVLLKEHDVTGNTTRIGKLTVVNKTKMYEVWPQYQYKVNNVLHTGEYKTNVYNSIAAAQNESNAIMNRTNKGITVFYVKANPAFSALSYPKNNMTGYLIGASIAVFIAILTRFATNGKTSTVKSRSNVNNGFTFTQYDN